MAYTVILSLRDAIVLNHNKIETEKKHRLITFSGIDSHQHLQQIFSDTSRFIWNSKEIEYRKANKDK